MKMQAIQFGYVWYAVVSLALSIVYFVYPHVVTKILPILALSVMAYGENNRYATMISAGLLFSSFGDIFLEFNGFLCFVAGMLNFLVAHILYISAYRSSVIDFKYGVAVGLLFLAYYGCLMAFLIPHVDTVLIPAILIYGGVICTMVFMGSNRFFTVEIGFKSRCAALVGSLVFVASDSTLSLNKFRGSIAGAGYIVMITYYIGQTFIAVSAKEPNRVAGQYNGMLNENEDYLAGTVLDTDQPLLDSSYSYSIK